MGAGLRDRRPHAPHHLRDDGRGVSAGGDLADDRGGPGPAGDGASAGIQRRGAARAHRGGAVQDRPGQGMARRRHSRRAGALPGDRPGGARARRGARVSRSTPTIATSSSSGWRDRWAGPDRACSSSCASWRTRWAPRGRRSTATPASTGARWARPRPCSSGPARRRRCCATFPSDEQRRQAALRRFYQDGDTAGARQLWRQQTDPPRNSIELAMAAEILADEGSEAALPLIEQLRPAHQTEADIVTAVLRVRQSRLDEAAHGSWRAASRGCERIRGRRCGTSSRRSTLPARSAPVSREAPGCCSTRSRSGSACRRSTRCAS